MGEPDRIRPPSPALLALEGRAWLEFASLLPALPLLARAPRGDGHPVLVLPGWLAGDRTTRPLRWFLRDRGYHAHGWKLGRNHGPDPDTVAGLSRRFRELRDRHGRRVTLIGWSLGGIYARELARHFPDGVRQVVTLASPFRDVSATSGITRIFRSAGTPERPDVHRRLRDPLPVPSTAIYSRTDGIVAWQSCLEDDGPQSESIAVESSHCGMGHHPRVLLVIANRLAQPDGAWKPYVERRPSTAAAAATA